MSPTSASTSAVSARRSFSRPGKTAILENDLTNTVAASEDFDDLPQRSAAGGSQNSVASTDSTLLNLGSLSSAAYVVPSARQQLRCKQFMESRDDVAQGVTSIQTDRQTRTSSSRSSTDDDDEYLREASRLNEHDLKKPEDNDRGPERRDA